jgi:hypothetical protein
MNKIFGKIIEHIEKTCETMMGIIRNPQENLETRRKFKMHFSKHRNCLDKAVKFRILIQKQMCNTKTSNSMMYKLRNSPAHAENPHRY